MATIYKYFGLIFLIFTRDEHDPIHVHVKKEDKMSIIEIYRDVKGNIVGVSKKKDSKSASRKKELSSKDLSTALKFVNIKAEEFVRAWKEIETNKYNGSPMTITRKIV